MPGSAGSEVIGSSQSSKSVTWPTVSELENTPIGKLISGQKLIFMGKKYDLKEAGKAKMLHPDFSMTPQGLALTLILCFFHDAGVPEDTIKAYPKRTIRDWLRWDAGWGRPTMRWSYAADFIFVRQRENLDDFDEATLVKEWQHILIEKPSDTKVLHLNSSDGRWFEVRWLDRKALRTKDFSKFDNVESKVGVYFRLRWPPSEEEIAWEQRRQIEEKKEKTDSTCLIF